MTDIYMNEVTGDIDITKRTLRLTETDIEEVRQKVLIRLLTIKGEWFANINAGIPYFTKILIKGVNRDFIDSLIRNKVLETNGVLNVLNFTSEFEAAERTYSATFKVVTSEGSIEITI